MPPTEGLTSSTSTDEKQFRVVHTPKGRAVLCLCYGRVSVLKDVEMEFGLSETKRPKGRGLTVVSSFDSNMGCLQPDKMDQNGPKWTRIPATDCSQ